ncbi:MAG TPA: type III pantothenate kinase [Bacteroidales bacterium]|nr:type III pantothenate kinase [Bacteroidales bacterium]
MLSLILDIGNTNVKLYFFSNGQIYEKSLFTTDTEVLDFLKINPNSNRISLCMISKVREISDMLLDYLNSKFIVKILDTKLKLPFEMRYKTPETLGQDRIAAVAGASLLYPGANALIIDAGTAITYDFLFEGNVYYGGTISPGVGIRFKALNTFTNKLPLLDIDMNNKEIFGQTTNDAIIIGVQNGVLLEVNGVIKSYQRKYKDLVVIFTGGYSFFFEKLIKNRIFAAPDLTAIGLNKILELNV